MDDPPVDGHVDALGRDRLAIDRVPFLGHDVGDPGNPENAVLAFDDRRVGVLLEREHRIEQGLVEVRLVDDPSAVAAGRGIGGGRMRPRDLVPRFAAFEVLQRLVRLGLCRCLLRCRGFLGVVVKLGLDLDQPQVALLRQRRLLVDLGLHLLRTDRDPLLGGKFLGDSPVDDPLEDDRAKLLAPLLDAPLLLVALGGCQATGVELVVDPAEGNDVACCLGPERGRELVAGDRLAVDGSDRREVLVVPVDGGRDDQDQDGDDDDQAEAQVGQEVAAVAAFPWAAALDDGFGSERHEWSGSLSVHRQGTGFGRADIVAQMQLQSGRRTAITRVSRQPDQPVRRSRGRPRPGPAGRPSGSMTTAG